ncbi:hypothetical protein [Mycolicibacterium fortuitum]|uniref:hypothetical protein n=1 Tax=Mycolicibacterium fortuitum TaxID=1766 RepID=UPI00241DEF6B|nr:hypothetical protein [Mycolicibacterium fortuitum]MDG5773930.1 hypothetical protein [Mycolicibacterium fortuitum]MDG5779684.1 hypothetical protein [Mycolicibacterium fortuitum]
MSDRIETVIAEAHAAHVWRGTILGCSCNKWNWHQPITYACGEEDRIERAHSVHVATAILAALKAARIATVDLPEAQIWNGPGRDHYWRIGDTTVGARITVEESMTDLSNVTIDGERQTWQQLYERERVKVLDLEGYRIMLADLDRNEHGRHEGDGDGYDPSGMSQGNPHLATGQVIGYSLHGSWKYVVPEPRLRGDLAAWRVRTVQP